MLTARVGLGLCNCKVEGLRALSCVSFFTVTCLDTTVHATVGAPTAQQAIFSRDTGVVWQEAWEGPSTWSATPAPSTHLPLVLLIAFFSSTPEFKPGLITQLLPVCPLLQEYCQFYWPFGSVRTALSFQPFVFGPTRLVESSNHCVIKLTVFSLYCGFTFAWNKQIKYIACIQYTLYKSNACWPPRMITTAATGWLRWRTETRCLTVYWNDDANWGTLFKYLKNIYNSVIKKNLFMKTNLVCVQPLAPCALSLLNV